MRTRWIGRAAVAAVLLGTMVTPAGEPVAAQGARPNIVLIFPDNLGWGEIGA